LNVTPTWLVDPAGLLVPERLLLVIALGFFFGLAYEEYFAQTRAKPPGGVRTFPLLSLVGALLYALQPQTGSLFLGGLVALGLWLAVYYWHRLDAQRHGEMPSRSPGDDDRIDAGIMAPVCNVIALLIGPVALATPIWVPVAVAVTAVLFAGARERLHSLSASMGSSEFVTLAKFLIIIGIILPLVPDTPVTSLTPLTPYEVWLAVVAVSTLSYASYLVQRYLAPDSGVLISAALGGLYSSTATTVVLARRARIDTGMLYRVQAAIILSTAIMYLRILTVVAIFNQPLAWELAPASLSICAIGLVMSGLLYAISLRHVANRKDTPPLSDNPLELATALIFATIFILLTIGVEWAKTHFGQSGIFIIAGLAGVTDVDPFVLSMTQGAERSFPLHLAARAILVAASSNNILKATYTFVFAGRQAGTRPALALFLLAALGLAAAYLMAVPA